MSLPFLHITVLGPSNSGKTCLINAFVNNHCPQVYTATDSGVLYYRTLRVQNPKDGEVMTILVEIEDTPGSEPAPGDKRKPGQFTQVATGAPKSKGRANPPMSDLDAPALNSYQPMTPLRMGFIILFDVHDKDSFEHAKKAHEDLLLSFRKQHRGHDHPIVYFVANKVDKDPPDSDNKMNRGALKQYAKKHPPQSFTIMEVSATEFTRVRKLFRDMIEEIVDNPEMWMTAADKERAKAAEAKEQGGENCSVQ